MLAKVDVLSHDGPSTLHESERLYSLVHTFSIRIILYRDIHHVFVVAHQAVSISASPGILDISHSILGFSTIARSQPTVRGILGLY
jgi:hypothetical protein